MDDVKPSPPVLDEPPVAARVRELDVSLVLFETGEATVRALLESFGAACSKAIRVHLLAQDNGGDEGSPDRLAALARSGFAFASTRIEASPNVGFGAAHNANAARGRSEFLFVVNPDCELEPGVLDALLDTAHASPADVAAWELRQIPYEHPKAYDPVTLETRWVSAAAVLFRRRAFEEVGGFDPRIFLYAEDVDLSWRLRQRGWRLLYQPRLAVTHRTYSRPGEVKPLQVTEGVFSNLCLRARHGGPREVARGAALLARELLAPSAFPRRRRGLVKAGIRFLRHWPHFARTPCRAPPQLRHRFIGWDFEQHREGAFHAMRAARETAGEARPLVSILIRTVDRPGLLRHALASCAHQTYANLEVVVVDNGDGQARAVVDEFTGRVRITYRATGGGVGRARAGNVALEAARGEWLNFLDDDDLLFADHVEVLVDAVTRSRAAGAYALAWEARTRIVDARRGEIEEVALATRHREPFDRLALWHHNFLPIQSVLFHRRLYERHGGFAEDMEQLEDWNLWTRYTLEDDFVRVPKTTSKYRVPDDRGEEIARHARLELAYEDAIERQRHMRASLSPREISEMAAEFARRRRFLTRIDARFPRLGRWLRRLGPLA